MTGDARSIREKYEPMGLFSMQDIQRALKRNRLGARCLKIRDQDTRMLLDDILDEVLGVDVIAQHERGRGG